MSINEIINFTLFEYDKYKLTVLSLLLVALIYAVTKLLVITIKKVLDNSKYNNQIGKGRVHSTYLIFKYLIWLIAAVLMLQSVGLKLTFLLAGSAALLVGLGFGLQQIFADIVSGVFLLFEGSIQVGNVLEVDNIIGRVKSIQLRTSKVISRDGIIIIIPNHKFISENVVNWSNSSRATRFKIKVGVAYGSDVEKVRDLLLECALKNNSVIKESKDLSPIVRLIDFGSSSLDFELLFWSKNVFRVETTLSDIRFDIVKSFNTNNISIPFPQMDVHMIKNND